MLWLNTSWYFRKGQHCKEINKTLQSHFTQLYKYTRLSCKEWWDRTLHIQLVPAGRFHLVCSKFSFYLGGGCLWALRVLFSKFFYDGGGWFSEQVPQRPPPPVIKGELWKTFECLKDPPPPPPTIIKWNFGRFWQLFIPQWFCPTAETACASQSMLRH